MEKSRWSNLRFVAHVDMDAFFAAVEVHDHPALRGKPVIAGGSADGKRGVVCSATYEARKYGVRSAMPASKAKSLCPDAVFMLLRFARYESVSEQIGRIFLDFTPLVQQVSIDEAYLDLTGREGFDGAVEEAREIQRRILDETGLTASVGVATGKMLAKIASDHGKPNGFVVVRPGEEAGFLAPLPVSAISGVGPKTTASFEKLGIRTIGEIGRLGPKAMERVFGLYGARVYRFSCGLDESRVAEHGSRMRGSISAQSAFGSSRTTWDEFEEVLLDLAERVASRARRKGYLGRTVSLRVRYRDFRSASRDATLRAATSGTEAIFKAAAGLLRKISASGAGFTRLGIALSNLEHDEGEQLNMFGPEGGDSHRRVDGVMDEIRRKLGHDAVVRGRLLRKHRAKRGTDDTMSDLEA